MRPGAVYGFTVKAVSGKLFIQCSRSPVPAVSFSDLPSPRSAHRAAGRDAPRRPPRLSDTDFRVYVTRRRPVLVRRHSFTSFDSDLCFRRASHCHSRPRVVCSRNTANAINLPPHAYTHHPQRRAPNSPHRRTRDSFALTRSTHMRHTDRARDALKQLASSCTNTDQPRNGLWSRDLRCSGRIGRRRLGRRRAGRWRLGRCWCHCF